MIFGTHDRWNAQSHRIGDSGTFYFESSTFISFIKYKRVNQEYPIYFQYLRPFLGMKSGNRPVTKTLATKFDCCALKTFCDTNKI